jgi:hypothetical protein
MSRQKSSSGDNVHPYLKVQFWMKSENQFWNDPKSRVSDSGKDYFNQSVENMVKNERRSYLLENPA